LVEEKSDNADQIFELAAVYEWDRLLDSIKELAVEKALLLRTSAQIRDFYDQGKFDNSRCPPDASCANTIEA
jgi:hypothetical protein